MRQRRAFDQTFTGKLRALGNQTIQEMMVTLAGQPNRGQGEVNDLQSGSLGMALTPTLGGSQSRGCRRNCNEDQTLNMMMQTGLISSVLSLYSTTLPIPDPHLPHLFTCQRLSLLCFPPLLQQICIAFLAPGTRGKAVN